MTETSARRKPSSPSASPSAPYYGLATQLRTPPTDFKSSFPKSESLSTSSASKKLTPAMRDEFGFAPKFVPQWSTKGERDAEEEAARGSSHEGSPALGALRSSPSHPRTFGRHSTAPRPHHTPHASMSTSAKPSRREESHRDTPLVGKVDFSFKPMQQPLDLSITIEPVAATTYQGRTEEPVAPPEATATLPGHSGSLFRKRSQGQNDRTAGCPSIGSPSLARTGAHPSPSTRPPPMTLPESFAAAFPLSRTITPASKGSMNLIALARRTTHLAEVPGYAWRLNLLEKLEVLTGSFIAIRDAESILAIGDGQHGSTSIESKQESRKSRIIVPATTPKDNHKLTKTRASKAKADDHKSFFGKMRRALSNPGAPQSKETVPPLPPPRKVVFGQKLSQVAEYGFVTSMIAGQRHDLPGVCFSTVEEIYRRGQGSKVPGLLQLAGEPGRVARLVQIFDAGPDYGEHHDLSVESIHNVCSLLKKYLHDLPEPVLDERVYRLFLAGCVDSTNSISRRIASAQVILRLLPSANFSLLVYLVAFLSQIPLFPTNTLPLSVVSKIFGTSMMSPRKTSSSASSPTTPSLRKPRGQMIITSPTDLVDDRDGKKANQALEWLLTNWSAVADGLLEPDFDVEVEAIVGSSVGARSEGNSSPPMVPLSPRIPQSFDAAPSTLRTAPGPPSMGPLSTKPPVPISSPLPTRLAEEKPTTSQDEIPRYLDSLEDDEEDSGRNGGGAIDSLAAKTPRPQSESSYATSIETPPTRSFEDRRDSKKTIEQVQLSPEDERGPLDLAISGGDEVVEFDDYSSVYSFPAPPSSLPTNYHHRLPSLPPSPFLTQDEIALALAEQDRAVQSATIHQSSTFAPLEHEGEEEDPDRTEDLVISTVAPATKAHSVTPAPNSDFEPKRKSLSSSGVLVAPPLVRTKSVQLEESRTLVLQQRLEIQNLWTKLSSLEHERTQERQEMIELTREVEGFKLSLRKQVEDVDGGEELRSELENVRGELKRCEAEREKERLKAREQVDNLEKQLHDIRKVLVPLLGANADS